MIFIFGDAQSPMCRLYPDMPLKRRRLRNICAGDTEIIFIKLMAGYFAFYPHRVILDRLSEMIAMSGSTRRLD